MERESGELKARGQYKEALKLLDTYIQKRERQAFPKDFILAAAFRERAALRRITGGNATKTDCLWKAISIDVDVFGRDHPIVAYDYIAIADALIEAGQQAEAQAYYTQAITILSLVFGTSHPATQNTFEKLARSAGPIKIFER